MQNVKHNLKQCDLISAKGIIHERGPQIKGI